MQLIIPSKPLYNAQMGGFSIDRVSDVALYFLCVIMKYAKHTISIAYELDKVK